MIAEKLRALVSGKGDIPERSVNSACERVAEYNTILRKH